MDALAALALQVEWGADEALEDTPRNRLDAPAPPRAAMPGAQPSRAPIAVAPITATHPAEACADLPALAAALASFTGCALADTAANTLWLEGPAEAGVLVIGDPPAAEDDRAGTVFQSPDAALVLAMLGHIGLERPALGLCPLIPWRPPGDRPPNAAELAACLPFTRRLITLARPRVLVLAGGLASRSLTAPPSGAASGERRRTRLGWVAPEGEMPALLVLGGIATLRTSAPGKQTVWAGLRQMRRYLDGVLAKS